MRFAKALMALTMACLMAAPAFSMPFGNGAMDDCREGMGGMCGSLLLMDDLTEEEMETMTLAELETLREEKMAEMEDMTIAELKALRDEQRAECQEERNNMTIAELKEQGRNNKFGVCMEKGANLGDGMNKGANFGIGTNMRANCGDRTNMGACTGGVGMSLFLQMDLAEEELNNMTVGELKELREEKMEEMENMTLSELKELREQQMDELTLGELNGQRMQQKCDGAYLGGQFGRAA